MFERANDIAADYVEAIDAKAAVDEEIVQACKDAAAWDFINEKVSGWAGEGSWLYSWLGGQSAG